MNTDARQMSLAQTVYPIALASLNLVTGWLVYTHVAPVPGALSIAVGLVVGLAVVVGLVRDHSRLSRGTA